MSDIQKLKQEVMLELVGHGNSGNSTTIAMWNCIDYLAATNRLVQEPAQDRAEALALFDDAIQSIRWMLNHASETPKKQIGTLLSCFTLKDNHTSRVDKQLEILWEKRETIRSALSIPAAPVEVIEQVAEALENIKCDWSHDAFIDMPTFDKEPLTNGEYRDEILRFIAGRAPMTLHDILREVCSLKEYKKRALSRQKIAKDAIKALEPFRKVK